MKYFHPKRIYNRTITFIKNYFWFYLLPDKWYLSIKYRENFGKSINWHNPKSFNEKINWLKIYDRNPNYKLFVDKIRVKSIISELIGCEYVIPMIRGGYSRVSDIDIDSLPNKFVLKCNHDSASTIICKDKSTFDWKYAEYKLNWCMSHDYYHFENKQWAYKDIERYIFVEEYIEDIDGDFFRDYKFYVFNGEVKCILVNTYDKTKYTDMFDINWERMPITEGYKNFSGEIPRPRNFIEMRRIAERIAQYIDNPFVRIDLYDVNDRIYFGEVTFYPAGGMTPFLQHEWDDILGSWMDISIVQK